MNDIDSEIPHVNYTVVFDFEEQFDYQVSHLWMARNWKQSFYYVGLYLTFIVAGRWYMKSRPRFELRGILFIWNVLLATFSIVGTLRVLPEMLYILREFGFHHSVCNPSYARHTKVSAFWTWMFALSKAPELGDTVFIVLRKQPLIFLHWYHHITVLLYTWYSVGQLSASGRWFMVMNYTAHGMMYSYYALKALRIHVPKSISAFITTVQISQMVVGLYVNHWSYTAKKRGDYCHVTDENIRVSLLMYLSYFLLFLHFFYKAYLRRGSVESKRMKKVK